MCLLLSETPRNAPIHTDITKDRKNYDMQGLSGDLVTGYFALGVPSGANDLFYKSSLLLLKYRSCPVKGSGKEMALANNFKGKEKSSVLKGCTSG
jgi:hypothetical protein